jgi:hypothetical protein
MGLYHDAVSPAWDANGKYLNFIAITNYALRPVGWILVQLKDRYVVPLFNVLKKRRSIPIAS